MRYARLLACLLLIFLVAAIGSQLLRRALPGSELKAATAVHAAGAGRPGAGPQAVLAARCAGGRGSTSPVPARVASSGW